MAKQPSRKTFFQAEISELLHDSAIIKFAKLLDVSDIPSLLDLLEYGLTRCEISRAIAKDLATVDIDKEVRNSLAIRDGEEANIIMDNVKYQKILGCKVRLTELGLYILDCIKGFVVEWQAFKRTRITMLGGSAISIPKDPSGHW